MAYDSTNTGAEVDAAIAKVAARSGDLIDGSGNATKITKFSGANTITDSIITDSGSAVTVAGAVVANTFSVADGTASLPSITNTGDTNTGIYFPTENSIAFTAGAGATLTSTNTALTIGVPTAIESSAQADLTLQGGDANSKNLIFKKASAQQGKISVVSDELIFYTGTTERMRIDDSGNVGIGSDPAHKLDVNGTGKFTGVLSVNNDLEVTGTVKEPNDSGNIVIQGGNGAHIELYGTGHSNASEARYDANTHKFRPLDGSADSLNIIQNGNVGVGTDTPLKKLHIASNANGQTTADIPGIRIENTDTTAADTNVAGEIEFFSKDASEADKISGYIKNVAEDAGTKYALTFGSKDTSSNATERMRIDADGNVGINRTNPGYTLDVNGTGNVAGTLNVGNDIQLDGDFKVSGTVTEKTDTGNLVLSGGLNGGAHIELYGTTHATTSIRNNAYHDAGVHVFRPVDGSAANFLITSAGDVAIGPASPAHALDVTGTGRFSTGVTFGSDTAAANKLDDYEEGTWTPAITFGGGSTGVTYSYQVGTHTKIGDLVTASCYMALSSKGSSTGAAVLTGLPFASRNLSANLVPVTLRISNISFADFPMGWNQAASTEINLQETTNAGTTTNLTDANFSNSSEVMISISYRV